MKLKYLRIALILIIILSIITNFNFFLTGGIPSILGISMTILYILCWSLFIKSSRYSKKDLLFSIVWSVATLACSAIILVQSLNESLMLSFIIPFAMIFITPLYAIIALFNQPGFLVESIALTAISLTWVAVSSIFFKRIK